MGEVKGEEGTGNREQRTEKAILLLELLRFAAKSKGGRHARCSKSKAHVIFDSDAVLADERNRLGFYKLV